MMTEFNEYPEFEQQFNKYEFAWMSKPLGSYQPNLVREFFANYLALTKKDYPKGLKISNLPNWESIPVRGVTIDILARTLNRMLFGLNYKAPAAVPDLEHCITTTSNQRPWLSRLLTDKGNPLLTLNPKEHIAKASLSFRAKFWWAFVRLWLTPTEGDANLDSHRAVLVASLVARLKINFGQIITDELFVQAHKVASALSFSCLIMKLCK